MIGFSVNLAMMCVFCFIAGLGIGGDLTALGSIFIEFCPPDKRWRLTLLNSICAIGGVLVPLYAFIFAVINTPSQWRWVTLTVVVVEIISLVTRIRMIETPKFYISIHQYEKASEVLGKVAEINSLENTNYSFLGPKPMGRLNSEQSSVVEPDV